MKIAVKKTVTAQCLDSMPSLSDLKFSEGDDFRVASEVIKRFCKEVCVHIEFIE